MRAATLMAGLVLVSAPAAGQERPAQATGTQAAGEPVYEMVAGDRETAWRLNRITGEMVICRVDTTGSLEAARARCAPVALETLPQQSRSPAAGSGRP